MRRRTLLFSTCAVLLLLSVLIVPASGIDVTGARVIDSPGTYVLQKDIINSGSIACIQITSSDVIFEGNGHTIDGLDLPNRYGIYIHSLSGTLSNVSVRNVTVQDWHFGLFYYNAMHGTIENCTAVSNAQNGIYLSLARDSTVFECNASANGVSGIFMDYSQNNTIGSSSVDSNPYGIRIYLSSSNRLMGNRISDNDYGMYFAASGGNTIYNNLFNNTWNAAVVDTSSNTWNTAQAAGSGINGGPNLGGNLWLHPNGSAFSAITPDWDDDGICDEPYTVAVNNMDQLPLAAVIGQHTPLFAPEWPLRFLRPSDGAETAQPTAYYYLFDNSSPAGKGDQPDILHFVVKMLDAGLTLAADVSGLDGNLTPLTPYRLSGTEYYFRYPLGNASFGSGGNSTRYIPIHAHIGGFQNSTGGSGGSPPPLAVVVNPTLSSGNPLLTATDLKTIDDFTAVEGLALERVLENETLGAIYFEGPLNLCEPAFMEAFSTLWEHVQIEEGSIALDIAADGLAALNGSATLQMHTPNFSTSPGIFMNGEPAYYANGTPADGSPVTHLRWDNSTKILRFNITHWTRYHADGNGPEVSIAYPEQDATVTPDTVRVTGTASDTAGVARVEVQVNGGTWEVANGTTTWDCTVLLEEGPNTIVVRATDGIGCNDTFPLAISRPPSHAPTPTVTPLPSPSHPAQHTRSSGGGGPAITHWIGNATLTTTGWGEVLRTITLESEDGLARLTIPAGTIALHANRTPMKNIWIEKASLAEMQMYAPGQDRRFTGYAYLLGPEGAQFHPPVTLTLRAPMDGGEQVVCMLFTSAKDDWVEIPLSPDSLSGKIQMKISVFGLIALFSNDSLIRADTIKASESHHAFAVAAKSTPNLSPTAPQSGIAGAVKEILGFFCVIAALGLYAKRGRNRRN